MNKILKIGITGGIGSGKTTVCHLFEKKGIPVYYADAKAKELVEKNQDLKNAIIQNFGNESYFDDGKYNIKFISNLVFKNNSKLQVLSNIIHPYVIKDAQQWHEAQQNVPFTIKESALLFENKLEYTVDKIITVIAPLEIRIQRLLLRDNLTNSQIVERIEKQLPDDIKTKFADFVVVNDNTQNLESQIQNIYKILVHKSVTKSK